MIYLKGLKIYHLLVAQSTTDGDLTRLQIKIMKAPSLKIFFFLKHEIDRVLENRLWAGDCVQQAYSPGDAFKEVRAAGLGGERSWAVGQLWHWGQPGPQPVSSEALWEGRAWFSWKESCSGWRVGRNGVERKHVKRDTLCFKLIWSD